ncbi:MAG: diacylglycerol kinase [Ruminococcaceae bacterium]|nr:diacylglycerol kinase [Oscillospiraceae bacterium]
MNRNTLKIALGIATVFFLIVAIVLFVLGLTLDISTLPRVILIIVSLLAFVLGVELGYFVYLLIDKNPNYFLYNTQTKRNMSVQKLTFQHINSRMNRYLSGYATSEGRIWNDRVFDDPYLEMEDEFRPLVAYKLLFGLAEKDAEAGWKCLENSSDDTVAFICKGLRANGDGEFATAIENVMSQKPVNIKVIRDYLIRNRKYMQNKMFKYVIDNIDKFQ